MAISWDNQHKHKTRVRRKPYPKKPKFELGQSPASNKISPHQSTQWESEEATKSLWPRGLMRVISGARASHPTSTALGLEGGRKLHLQPWEGQLPTNQSFCSICRTPEEEEILNKKHSKKIQKKYEEWKKKAKISLLLREHFCQASSLPTWHHGEDKDLSSI
ncbi:40S ribosomal protein S8-like [Monodelphis domestica]|uniref:40S ribosomal protein S8-like n=1 Tax=Monodelphis domestica TaxID=13616 RepID=UPI0024E2232D|nr:40S ribosomal protein S8-like [Monodelphis domestica]